MSSFEDLTGSVFGRLTVLGRAESLRRYSEPHKRDLVITMWLCSCECGKETTVRHGNLKTGQTKSCGCLRKHKTGRLNRKHGLAKKVPEYGIWKNMRKRCNNPADSKFQYYGAKGIKVCNRWTDFESFYNDMGPRPTPNHTIDRIDNSNGYSPDNCRWATRQQQSENRTKDIRIKSTKANKTGVVGVVFDKTRGKWKSTLTVKGEKVLSKRFDSFDEAVKARKSAENEYWRRNK